MQLIVDSSEFGSLSTILAEQLVLVLLLMVSSLQDAVVFFVFCLVYV